MESLFLKLYIYIYIRMESLFLKLYIYKDGIPVPEIIYIQGWSPCSWIKMNIRMESRFLFLRPFCFCWLRMGPGILFPPYLLLYSRYTLLLYSRYTLLLYSMYILLCYSRYTVFLYFHTQGLLYFYPVFQPPPPLLFNIYVLHKGTLHNVWI